MELKTCQLIGAPIDSGKRTKGCAEGPVALRGAGLVRTLRDLGHAVQDHGDLNPPSRQYGDDNRHIHQLHQTIAWTKTIYARATRAMQGAHIPIFLGGDHALSMGTVSAAAHHAASLGRPLFVLWLDAHSDFHTPASTSSGHLHGTPVAYITGQRGFEAFPPLPAPELERNICLFGLRSVDQAEASALKHSQVQCVTMAEIRASRPFGPLGAFLARVRAASGLLHVSLDVDFLDPSDAPGVGTTVPDGPSLPEAQALMQTIHDSGLISSIDVVELNPRLDVNGKTARALVDLVARLMGRTDDQRRQSIARGEPACLRRRPAPLCRLSVSKT